MKNKLKLLGIIAAVAAIGFSMTSCGDNGGGGRGVPAGLLGVWERTGVSFEIALDSGMYGGVGLFGEEGNAPIEARGNSIHFAGVSGDSHWFDFALAGDTLTISNISDQFIVSDGEWTRQQ